MPDHLIIPGHSPDPGPARVGEEVDFVSTEPVMGADGRLYELRIEGTADVERGPLGQFLDLRERLGRDVVPAEVNDVLDRLAAP